MGEAYPAAVPACCACCAGLRFDGDPAGDGEGGTKFPELYDLKIFAGEGPIREGASEETLRGVTAGEGPWREYVGFVGEDRADLLLLGK